MPGPIIDCHIHPLVHERQHRREPWLLAPESYLAAVEGLGIERAAALVVASQGDMEMTRLINNGVLELAGKYDGFFFPVCSVHPFDGGEALRELERVVAAGARWLKLHPYSQGFDVAAPEVAALVRKAGDLGVTVLFDAASPTDGAEPGKFVQLAMDAKETRLILAHAHAMAFSSLLVYEILARYPWWPRKVWVDISGTAALLAGSPYAEQFTWILRKMGTDRVLFGSDWGVFDPRQAVEAVTALGFTVTEQRAILYDNAAQLLGLAPG
jgi:predicted TIM-barrel fold metal-dependent hydrolase